MWGSVTEGISLGRYQEGKHTLNAECGEDFFEQDSLGLLKDGRVSANLQMERVGNVFRMTLELSGTVRLQCDSCLSDYTMPVSGKLNFLVKLTEEMLPDDEDNEIYFVPLHPGVFQLQPHVYDLLHLSLPLRKVCEQPGETEDCDKITLAKLKSLNGTDGGGTDDNQDPRWDKLKDLL